MTQQVTQIHFRYLTATDFFNIYKPADTEAGGGGQTYVDFPTAKVPRAAWDALFDGLNGLTVRTRANGPEWEFPVFSLGIPQVDEPQRISVYQRRAQSIVISSQNVQRREGNRIIGWLPPHGFPAPADASQRHGQLPDGLCVYLFRTTENQIGAGWFLNGRETVVGDEGAADLLAPMLAPGSRAGSAGVIRVPAASPLFVDEEERLGTFKTEGTPRITLADVEESGELAEQVNGEVEPSFSQANREIDLLKRLIGEDSKNVAQTPEVQDRVRRIRKRNIRAVRALKALYQGRCQLTGEEFIFQQRNGSYYCEVHHLIPLGDGGDDDPKNMIVVSPLIHRMFHHARVSGLNLNGIEEEPSGAARLNVTLAGTEFTIRWHPEHAALILRFANG